MEFLTTFTYPSFQQSPQPWPVDYTTGSLAAQDPSFAQISMTYDYDKFVTECTAHFKRGDRVNDSVEPIKVPKSTRRTNLHSNNEHPLPHPRNANPHPRPDKL